MLTYDDDVCVGPRLFQLSSGDVVLNSKTIHFEGLSEFHDLPWEQRDQAWNSLLLMCIRGERETGRQYDAREGRNRNVLDGAFKAVHGAVRDAFSFVTDNLRPGHIQPKKGEAKYDPMQRSLALIYETVTAAIQAERGSSKTVGEGLRLYTRRTWEAIMGMCLMLESKEGKAKCDKAKAAGADKKKLVELKNSVKSSHVMVRGGMSDQDFGVFKLRCLASLGVFLNFGVAGYPIAMTDRNPQTVASNIGFCALPGYIHRMAEERGEVAKATTWEERAFIRMDTHIMGIFDSIPTDMSGWDKFYTVASAKLQLPKLAQLFLMDVFGEVPGPGASMAVTGRMAVDVRRLDASEKMWEELQGAMAGTRMLEAGPEAVQPERDTRDDTQDPEYRPSAKEVVQARKDA